MADMTLAVKILGDASSLSGAVDSAKAKIDQLYSKVNNPAMPSGLVSVGNGLQNIGDKAISNGRKFTAAFTVPIVAGAKSAVSEFAEVDRTMTLTNETMQNSTEQADLLKGAMREAAMQSVFGMEDAANASLNFARAGLTAEEAASTLAPAMNLAAGEGGNLDTVSAGLVATINSFGDSFDNAGKYTDVFANACNNSALDVDSLAQSMSTAGPVFRTMGYDVKDAALMLGIMADNGVTAGRGAKALRTGFSRLLSPTDDMVGIMRKYNISLTDSNGNMKDVMTIQRELHDTFGSMTEAQQAQAASILFGKNRMAEWLALINAAPEDVAKLSEELDREGTTNEMAAAMMDGFGGALMRLQSTIDVAKEAFGEALAPAVQKVVDKLQALTEWFIKLEPEQREHIANIAMIVAAIGPLLLVFGHLSKSLGGLLISFGGIIEKGGILGRTLGFLLSPLGLVTGALVALVGGFIAAAKAPETLGMALLDFINKAGAKFVKFIQELPNKLAAMTNNLKGDFFENILQGKKSGQFVAQFITRVAEIYNAIRQAMIDNAPAIIEGITQLIQAIGANLQQNASQIFEIAKMAFRAIADAITAILPAVVEALAGLIEILVPVIVEMAPLLLDAAVQLFTALVEAIAQVIPQIIEAIGAVIPVIANALVTLAPLLIDAGIQLFLALVEAVITVLPQIIDAVVNIIPDIVDAIITALPLLLDAGVQLFLALVEALPIVLPQILDALAIIIPKLVDVLITAMPIFLDGAVKFFTAFIEALPIILPQLLEALGKLVFEVGEKLIEHIPDLLKAAANLFGAIVTAFINMHLAVIEEVLKFIVDFGKKFVDGIEKKIDNLDEWLGNAWENIKTTAGDAWDGLVEIVTDPIDAIKKAWNKLVDLLTTPISIPKIELPSIDIEGQFSLDPPEVPRFKWGGWHAKGALFSKPSVIGVGEAGPEAVAPIDKLKAYVAEAVTNARSATMDYTPIDSLADAIATGFAMQSAGQQGGEYHFTVELGGARVAEKIFTLNKEGEMIMQGA